MRAKLAIAAMLATTGHGCVGGAVVGARGEAADPACPAVRVGCTSAMDVPAFEPFPSDAFASPVRPCEARTSIVLHAGDELDSSNLACADIELDLGVGETVELRDAVLRDVEITARGAQDAVLRLSGTTAERVHVTLAGHAWLVVSEASVLMSVVADAAPDMEGAVVSVSRSHGSGFAVRTGTRGGVRIDQSDLEGGVLVVGTLDAEESSLRGVRLQVDEAHLAASDLFDAVGELGSAVLVESLVSTSRVDRCGSLRFIGSTIQRVFVASCDRPAAFAGGSISDSQLLGALTLSRTVVSASRFVPGHGAALTFLDALVRNSAFCAAEELTADGGELTCDACAPAITRVTLGDVAVHSPECPSLHNAAPL